MSRRRLVKTIIVLIVLSIIGGGLKIYGSIVGGSKSVFVDAATSIANTLAIVLILKFFREGMEPPDTDHHYGHHRLALGGPISMLMLYSFVTGLIVFDLMKSFGIAYEVKYESPIYASIAMIPYGIAVFMAKKSRSMVSSYGGFTAVELMESVVSITSSLGGAMISYIVDFLGALALTSYLFYELIENFREVVLSISDVAPRDIMNKVYRIVEGYGVDVERVRVRRVIENIYYGDIVVKVKPSTSIEKAHLIADKIEKELKKQGIDIVIHVEPSE